MRLLVVKGKVLDVAVHALRLDAADLGSNDLAGEQTVLTHVLVVAAAKGRAVRVGTGGVQAADLERRCLLGKQLAHVLRKLLVPGVAKHALARELRAVVARHDVVHAIGTIALDNRGLAHALGREGHPAAVGDEHLLLVERHLVEELVPLRVVIVQAGHVRQGKAVLRAIRHVLGIGVVES